MLNSQSRYEPIKTRMTVSLNKRRHHFRLILLLTLIPAVVAAVTLQDLPDFGDSAGGPGSESLPRPMDYSGLAD